MGTLTVGAPSSPCSAAGSLSSNWQSYSFNRVSSACLTRDGTFCSIQHLGEGKSSGVEMTDVFHVVFGGRHAVGRTSGGPSSTSLVIRMDVHQHAWIE